MRDLQRFVSKWVHPCICDHRECSAIAYLISVLNRCVFCTEIYEALVMAHGMKREAEAIHDHCFEAIGDARVRQAVLWAFMPHASASAEWVRTAEITHYTNRLANVVARRSAFPMTPRLLRAWIARRWMRAGTSWIQPRRAIPDFVPEELAQRIMTHISAWYGEEMGPNRGWVENYLADFSAADRAVGRLALLTALASHQVDSLVVAAFQEAHPQEEELTALVSCAAALGAHRAVQVNTARVVNAAA